MKSKLLFFCMVGAIWLVCQTNVLASTELSVEEFVHQIFLHGVPFAKAKEFESDGQAIDNLKQLLDADCIPRDSPESSFCSNIVVTLGIIGGDDEEAVRKMIGFINKRKGKLTVPEFRAKTSALIALGYWLNKSENQQLNNQIVQELSDVIDESNLVGNSNEKPNHYSDKGSSERSRNPYQWGGRTKTLKPSISPVAEIFSDVEDKDGELKRQFGRTAILGLALSGDPNAMDMLSNLLKRNDVRSDRSLRALILEAIDANLVIADKGLVCYYNEERAGC